MIPSQLLRKQLADVKASCESRGDQIEFNQWEDLEQQRKALQIETEQVQMQSNQLSKEVANLKRSGEDASDVLASLGEIAKRKKQLEGDLRELLDAIKAFELTVPNILSSDVPVGKDENDNQVVDTVGEPSKFDFSVKSHIDLAPKSLDFATAAKISGSRFVLMRGGIARLHRALGQWMLDTQVSRGYEEVNPPVLVQRHALEGTGQLPKFEDDQFFAGGHALIPTAEVPLTNMLRDEIVDYSQLPMSVTALTQCFRKEAGAYGKDTQGMIRQHQFEKVELVKFVAEHQAKESFEQLVGDSEFILQSLGLPYRKVLLCSGDTGFSASKTYDLEVWLPSENRYREISSCSYFTDFQARRMKARYRDEEGNVALLHTINGSGLAVGRTLIAVMENYQTQDGTIIVPEVLIPYMGGIHEIS